MADKWPRQPFVGIALASAAGIFLADCAPLYFSATLIGLAFVALIALITKRTLTTLAFVFAAFFFLHGLRAHDSPGRQLARELGDEPQALIVQGAVVTEPKVSATGVSSFLLKLKSVEIAGVPHKTNATILARWKHAVEFGDELNLFGTAQKIPPPRNPGEFDMGKFLARQHDVWREFSVGYAENGQIIRHGGGNPILRTGQKSRRWMQRALDRDLENSPDVQAAINGMVLGLRHQTPDDIEEPFQQTGTLHLFAVAGLHVGIVASLLWILSTVARVKRKWAIPGIIVALFFYAAITGWHISSVRAAIMSSLLLAGFFAERKVYSLNSLAVAAVLILGWNTDELFSVGFGLSFSVVSSIILIAGPAFRFLRRLSEPDSFLPRSLLSRGQRILDRVLWWLMRGISVSFAAWIGAIPLMLDYYYLITPISLLANLAVVPVAFFVLACGLISILSAPISGWLSVIFNNANWALTKMILALVHLFAQLPAGHIYFEHPHRPTGARAEITVLDLGAGGAVHLRTAGEDWLIDVGSRRDFTRTTQSYLRMRGVNRLDGLILTHGDAAHIGGALDVLQTFKPKRLVDTQAHDRSRVHQELIRELDLRKFARAFCGAGDEFKISRDVTARILFPPRGFEAKTADDQAIVMRLDIAGGTRALLMSDSGEATERSLLQTKADLSADLIVKGQHHSGVSGSDDFLDAVRPKAIIATSRDFPDNERIKDEWVANVKEREIKLLRQDQTGAVRVRFFGKRWEAEAFVTHEIFRSTNR